MNNLDLCLEVA